MRLTPTVIVRVLVLALAGLVGGVRPDAARAAPRADAPAAAAGRPLVVSWIDSEGGGSTLLVTPAGQAVLIDAGNPGDRDVGRIVAALRAEGLDRLDHVVVTHFHSDHFGGVAELAARVPIGTLWDNGPETAAAAERADPRLEPYRQAPVARRARIRPGARLPLRQAKGAAPLTLEFLAARQTYAPRRGRTNPRCADRPPGKEDPSDNRNSAVLLLTLGKFRFFDGGDLTWDAEAALVCPTDRVGPVDVYQTNHHGKDSSNHPVLVASLAPRVAVMNNGATKGNDPPVRATLRALSSLEAVYQMHRTVRPGEEDEAANVAADRIANADRDCAGAGIRMMVEPSGAGYTVEVPTTGHRQRYLTRGR
jgi:beta-lactamase superfamily II metal-dependent hydrolase